MLISWDSWQSLSNASASIGLTIQRRHRPRHSNHSNHSQPHRGTADACQTHGALPEGMKSQENAYGRWSQSKRRGEILRPLRTPTHTQTCPVAAVDGRAAPAGPFPSVAAPDPDPVPGPGPVPASCALILPSLSLAMKGSTGRAAARRLAASSHLMWMVIGSLRDG